jgi:hypothetical protein
VELDPAGGEDTVVPGLVSASLVTGALAAGVGSGEAPGSAGVGTGPGARPGVSPSGLVSAVSAVESMGAADADAAVVGPGSAFALGTFPDGGGVCIGAGFGDAEAAFTSRIRSGAGVGLEAELEGSGNSPADGGSDSVCGIPPASWGVVSGSGGRSSIVVDPCGSGPFSLAVSVGEDRPSTWPASPPVAAEEEPASGLWIGAGLA